jgi:tRNA dimethylallyltransferase
MSSKPRLIIIAGPTGIGKSALAMKLISEFEGEIISADSMQVYRFMDIGTAKPTVEDCARVKHHLIDIVNPDQNFSAAQFSDRARAVIDDLCLAGKRAWVVGGSGLYIKALIGGLVKGPGTSERLRDHYRTLIKEYGAEYLYEMLQEKDGEAAKRIHPNDTVRLMRALEVIEISGESIVLRQSVHRFADQPYECLKIGLMDERQRLHEKIDSRCNRMVEKGLVGEVEKLLTLGYHDNLNPMQSLGYKHMLLHVKGLASLDEALSLMKRDTRNYAKRQMTWFRGDGDMNWFRPEDADRIRAKIREFLSGH